MRRPLIVVALIVGLAMAASAQDYGAGLAAYRGGDYAAVMKQWRPLAEQGLAEAQHNLGFMYDEGLGLPQGMILPLRGRHEMRLFLHVLGIAVVVGGATARAYHRRNGTADPWFSAQSARW